MLIVSGLILGLVALLWLPIVSDVTSLIKVAHRHPHAREPRHDELHRLLFLVPAHDEESLIAGCVSSLRHMRYPPEQFEIVVVADNCSDRTAAVARAGGALCLERDEPSRPGKPLAISWAVARLDLDGFDALVILDADSIVEPAFAREIGTITNLPTLAVQAYNGVSNPGMSPITRMATVLAAAYYRFAYPLKQRAGLNAPLTGTGMCIGTGVLREYGWTARSLAEDVEYYTLLTLAGARTLTCAEARVLSLEAPSPKTGAIQRRRWTRGRLEVAREHLGQVLASGRMGPHQKLDLLAELLTPGPAVHLAVAALTVATAWIFPLPARGWIATLGIGSLVRPLAYAALGLRVVSDRLATSAAFLALPVYAAWRIGIEILSLLHRPRWTRRDR